MYNKIYNQLKPVATALKCCTAKPKFNCNKCPFGNSADCLKLQLKHITAALSELKKLEIEEGLNNVKTSEH